MIVVTVCYGTVFAGIFPNFCDIAPNFSGLLMGIATSLSSISGFALPSLVGSLTHGVPGLAPWHTVFYITSGLLFLEFLIFTFFTSVEEQPWNKGKHQDRNREAKLGVNQVLAETQL